MVSKLWLFQSLEAFIILINVQPDAVAKGLKPARVTIVANTVDLNVPTTKGKIVYQFRQSSFFTLNLSGSENKALEKLNFINDSYGPINARTPSGTERG